MSPCHPEVHERGPERCYSGRENGGTSGRTEQDKTPQSRESASKGLGIHTNFHESTVPEGWGWEQECAMGFLATMLLRIWIPWLQVTCPASLSSLGELPPTPRHSGHFKCPTKEWLQCSAQAFLLLPLVMATFMDQLHEVPRHVI